MKFILILLICIIFFIVLDFIHSKLKGKIVLQTLCVMIAIIGTSYIVWYSYNNLLNRIESSYMKKYEASNNSEDNHLLFVKPDNFDNINLKKGEKINVVDSGLNYIDKGNGYVSIVGKDGNITTLKNDEVFFITNGEVRTINNRLKTISVKVDTDIYNKFNDTEISGKVILVNNAVK